MTEILDERAVLAEDRAEDDLPPKTSGAWLGYLIKDKKALIGAIVLGVLIVSALLAPWIVPYDPEAMDYTMMEGISWAHPLGTDDLGRDLLSRLIYGARISLLVGFSTVAISLVIGVVLGVMAGYFGGVTDMVIMRYIDLQWAFPNFIIAVYLVAVIGQGLLNVIIAISLAFIDDFARIVRGMVLSIREEQYIDAAKCLGYSDARIMFR
ncbi:MAG: ABC transporter permease, partial [Methyloligellaceae bacterium]